MPSKKKNQQKNINNKKNKNENETTVDKEVEKTRVETEIFGEEFSIIGDMTPEEIKKAADMVDEIMSYINEKYPKLSYHKVAVLTALNIAEDYLKLEKEHKDLIDLMEKVDNNKGKRNKE